MKTMNNLYHEIRYSLLGSSDHSLPHSASSYLLTIQLLHPLLLDIEKDVAIEK